MDASTPATSRRPGRLKTLLKCFVALLFVSVAVGLYAVKDEIRTLASLRRIGESNAYEMDYYCDYNLEDIRTRGIDVASVEDSLIEVHFSNPAAWIAKSIRSYFIPSGVEVLPDGNHHCSTVVFRNDRGETVFGRNFDWMHNASLTLRIHRDGGVQSVAMIDLAYLNLDRADLDKSSYLERMPLLFAPYYLMDGMNSHGVAIADMSLEGSRAPYDAEKPSVLHSTAMRMVLDYATTTTEAIELLANYNVRFAGTPVHLMIADAHGGSAVVEFLDGEMRSTPADGSWQACTNSQIWGVSEEDCDQVCDRYRVASQQLEDLRGDAGVNDIMDVMQAVSAEGWTMWSSVYNLSTGEFLLSHRKSSGSLHREQPMLLRHAPSGSL